ncbi:hypothetical protein [Nigerium massiliense]|uniref:hypothetical protein n=1 Tax=Nigerium massiliense TaxID=1522317 RepID=UPI00058E50C4|nr:hypothetical protein [Nigerium massiliense]
MIGEDIPIVEGVKALDPELLQAGLVDARGATAAQRQAVSRLARKGRLRRILPGIWAPSRAEMPAEAIPENDAEAGNSDRMVLLTDVVELRVRALMLASPDAVVTGRAAARLTWWPDLEAPVVTAVRRQSRPAAGFRFQRRRLGADRVVTIGRLRVTDAAQTVLDLVDDLGGRVIDEALRRRVVTLAQLWTALDETPHRRGNRRRRWLLHDSRDQPWSEAERALHHVLRGLSLPCAWSTNHRVVSTAGTAYLDAALPDLLLAIEVDGFEFHTTRDAFLHDRDRDMELAIEGWQVVRVAAGTLLSKPAHTGRQLLQIVAARLSLMRRGGKPRPSGAGAYRPPEVVN